MATRIVRTPTTAATPASTRVIRRVSRAAVARREDEAALQEQRALDEQLITQGLQSIARLQDEIAERAKLLQTAQDEVEKLMRKHKILDFSDGRLEARIVQEFTREAKEIDPAVLYGKIAHPAFFACVKVQLTKLKEYMAEGEIRAISKITPPVKAGTKFVVEPVKPVVVNKPERKAPKKRGR